MADRRPAGIEVARLAGVSQKTVSRVVNGEPNVSSEVRDRVLRVAEELGYRPNKAARALLTGRHQRLGVVWTGANLHGPTQTLVTVELAARARGYSVSVTSAGPSGDLSAAVDSLLAQGVDGILVDEPVDDHPLLASPPPLPVLTLGHDGDVDGSDWIAAVAAAVQHLLDLGHRTVHHVGGPVEWWTARDRTEGWRRALQHAGAVVPEPLTGDWSAASGHRAGRRLLTDPSVTAVFCANDEMALGVVRAWTEAGRRVPQDLSVVGVDDIPVAEFVNPPLTTLRQEFQLTADRAVSTLIDRIEGRAAAGDRLRAVPSLVVRASTAPPP
ncbi:LacI family DNA-binding transcriptional regulator [Kineococcus rhizosphaerae]|uniref:LacI family transcriptional regulator n=1 Tax=Kineococcus rhizosphaerae TaxID=559628 RepID=A0A2T0R4K4_9ACTN|nr:LacI family DNA-binding transcriptional regulator [Kineococcus rhizosphaerae]PRY15291.1 LacI family transcriptional regulator [Kineococcus rhizosphaerae]